jgi:chromate transport protein ChrA
MMHDETVKRRKWLSDQEFLDLVGAAHLIPGSNSTEMAIHIGFLRTGWRECSFAWIDGRVTWQLGRAFLTGPLPIFIAFVSFVLLIWFKVNSTWLIAGGGLIGLLSTLSR